MADIIARIDPANRSAVFLLDTLDYSKQAIQVWYPDQDEIVASNLDYYKTTRSPSDADEKIMADAYVQKFGIDSSFKLRRKLFRHTPDVKAALHNGQHPGVADSEKKPQGAQMPTHVITKGGQVIPAMEFSEKLLTALTNALREVLK